MAASNSGSGDARWFMAGVLMVAGIVGLAAWAQKNRGPTGQHLTRTEVATPADGDGATKKKDEPVAARTVLSRTLEKIEPELSAPQEMTADELLTAAREAWDKGRSTEAYRYATLSLRHKRTEAALEIKGKAACRVGGKGAAKAAASELRGARRRAVRRECRDHGIWLGL